MSIGRFSMCHSLGQFCGRKIPRSAPIESVTAAAARRRCWNSSPATREAVSLKQNRLLRRRCAAVRCGFRCCGPLRGLVFTSRVLCGCRDRSRVRDRLSINFHSHSTTKRRPINYGRKIKMCSTNFRRNRAEGAGGMRKNPLARRRKGGKIAEKDSHAQAAEGEIDTPVLQRSNNA